MTKVIEQFDAVTIENASIQFLEGGKPQPGTSFGCVGKLEGETELKEIIKKCAGIEVKKISRPQKMNMTITGHVPVAVVRNIFGLKADGLKPGVYAYGSKSKGTPFIFTADIVDEFEDLKKMIAFSNCTSTSGLKLTIENGGDEVAEIELEFTAMSDKSGEFYYEAITAEVADQEVVAKWHTQFTPELVKGSVVTP
jgi:hypothetical protein